MTHPSGTFSPFDTFEGLRDLVERCDAAAGTLEAAAIAALPAGTVLTHVDDASSRLSGFGMAQIGDDRAVLRVFVHPPDARRAAEILGALMRAMQAKRLFEHGWLRIERVLRPDTPALPRDMTAMYESLGFEFFYTEHEMHRDLREPLPATEPPDGIDIGTWSGHRDAEIREAYNESFRDRGFAGFEEYDWASASFSAQDSYRPDLSFLALDGELLAGFCLCEDAAEPDAGWINTVGVRPAYRGRGIGSAMIVRKMEAVRENGLAWAALRVNEHNSRARRLYERLGFVPVKKHVVYRKKVG